MYAQGFLTKLQLGQKKAENATFLKDPRFANSTPPPPQIRTPPRQIRGPTSVWNENYENKYNHEIVTALIRLAIQKPS